MWTYCQNGGHCQYMLARWADWNCQKAKILPLKELEVPRPVDVKEGCRLYPTRGGCLRLRSNRRLAPPACEPWLLCWEDRGGLAVGRGLLDPREPTLLPSSSSVAVPCFAVDRCRRSMAL